MKRLSITLAVAGIGLSGQVLAADVDMSKLTCKELVEMPTAKIMSVAIWVNGYVHGEAGDPVVDIATAHTNGQKVIEYCDSNPGITLFDAIEAIAKS